MKALKNVLMINAVSSGATGLLLVFFPGFFASLFGVQGSAAFVGTGIFLILFAILVFSEARRETVSDKSVRFISTLDVLWVVGSLVIIVFGLFGLSLVGYLMIGAVAAWVALMAMLQLRGVRKIAA